MNSFTCGLSLFQRDLCFLSAEMTEDAETNKDLFRRIMFFIFRLLDAIKLRHLEFLAKFFSEQQIEKQNYPLLNSILINFQGFNKLNHQSFYSLKKINYNDFNQVKIDNSIENNLNNYNSLALFGSLINDEQKIFFRQNFKGQKFFYFRDFCIYYQVILQFFKEIDNVLQSKLINNDLKDFCGEGYLILKKLVELLKIV